MASRTHTSQGKAQIRCTRCRRSGWINYHAETFESDEGPTPIRRTTVSYPATGHIKTLTRRGDLDVFRHAVAKAINDCGHPLKIVTVNVVINTEHDCGPRCLTAVGPSCDCSCGGDNHGAAHGAW